MIRRCLSVVVLAGLLSGVQSSLYAQGRLENSLSVSFGTYAASGFGNNLYGALGYNYFFLGGRYFVEASLGVSSLTSRVLENVSRAQIFNTNRLLTYQFAVAFDPSPSGAIPFFLVGFAGVNQGGVSAFAGVLGLGKRIPGLFGSNTLGFRYDVRDQIFSQSINGSDPFIVHNFVFSIGLQIYF
jgi:hypothetical protein